MFEADPPDRRIAVMPSITAGWLPRLRMYAIDADLRLSHAIIGDDALLGEARAAAAQVRAALPWEARQAFKGSELVRLLLR